MRKRTLRIQCQILLRYNKTTGLLKNILHFPYFLYACIVFAVLIILSFPITLVLLLFPASVTDAGMFWLMKIISNAWFILIGVIPKNYNRRNINFANSYIITPNHQSFLDAAIIYTSIPHVFKTLGKKEIEKAPVYGIIYKAVVITVDRSSLAARATSFRKMKTELDKGNSIVIFPEGTFSNTPIQNLLPFQDGCFSLAILQQTDILPILFIDTAKRLHPSKLMQFTPGWNRAIYLPPVSCKGLEKKDLDSLRNYTQEYMQACLNYSREHDKNTVWAFAEEWQKRRKVQRMN